MSPESMASENVHDEWHYAIEKGIPVIPIYLRTCEIHFRLHRINYVDFRSDRKKAVPQLLEELRKPIPTRKPEPETAADYEADLKSLNLHIRLEALNGLLEKPTDALLKMLAGAGMLAILQELREDDHPVVREKIVVLEDKSQQDLGSKRLSLGFRLAKPFEWVEIPRGRVTLERGSWINAYGEGKTFDVPNFEISKYPITVAQYTQFVDAGGYRTKRFWTVAGWQWRDRGDIKLPRYWDDKRFHNADHPVAGVSWYEAMAFCAWLSEQSGDKVLLPTEQQWQRAAQGDDGRTYPWGNKWDCRRCNNSVKPCNSNATTSVRQYEGKGDNPYGVVDMAGNVWEWCLTEYESGNQGLYGSNMRGLRGGSWRDGDEGRFRAAFRGGNVPDYRYFFRGFRVARS